MFSIKTLLTHKTTQNKIHQGPKMKPWLLIPIVRYKLSHKHDNSIGVGGFECERGGGKKESLEP